PSCKWRKQMLASLSREPVSISSMVGARPSVWTSSGAFWTPLSVPPKEETWLDWKISSQKMLSPPRIAMDLSERRGFWSLVASMCRHSLLPSREFLEGRDVGLISSRYEYERTNQQLSTVYRNWSRQ